MRELGGACAFETSKLMPSDLLPILRSHLLNPPKLSQQLRTKPSNIKAFEEHFHSDHYIIVLLSLPPPIISLCLSVISLIYFVLFDRDM